MINYVILGGGWRAEFYLRIASFIPDRFKVKAVYVRNKKRNEYIREKYNVKATETLEETLDEEFDFIVNCINKEHVSDYAVSLADRGYFVLCETPVTKIPEGKHNFDKIQVAEQFHLKGTFAAIKKIINMGIIGNVNHIEISAAHDYHAMSLLRFLLDDYKKPQLLGDYSLEDELLRTNYRYGEIEDKKLEKTKQIIKLFKFDNATALYNYNKEQYFSPIRKDRLLIRGQRGEIDNFRVGYYNKSNNYVESDIKLRKSGLLDGFYNDKITFEDKVLYEFPFKAARLSEEETAIAECLEGMKRYILKGTELYSFEKAYEDYKFIV